MDVSKVVPHMKKVIRLTGRAITHYPTAHSSPHYSIRLSSTAVVSQIFSLLLSSGTPSAGLSVRSYSSSNRFRSARHQSVRRW